MFEIMLYARCIDCRQMYYYRYLYHRNSAERLKSIKKINTQIACEWVVKTYARSVSRYYIRILTFIIL